MRIGKNVFVGPGAVIRADEPGSAISIGDFCNVQDRAVFLDRDGTINEDVGDLFEGNGIRFIPGSLDALRTLQRRFSVDP